ncbi:MAG: T9SS type A sorting domain-containing protein [Pigmentiphaga sp.]|nr:T9SS type A sorting domain-containing protein [Pigmentiphaga sp.]
MNKITKNIVIVTALIFSNIVFSQTVNMHLWATGENHNRAVKTVPLLDNYVMKQNGDDVFNRYGHDSRIKTNSTGFFYTKKINDRWWLIDPDGYAGINMSVTSLPDLNETNAVSAFEILRKNGFNGTGNFLAKENMTKVYFSDKRSDRLAYTRRKNFFQNYRVQRQQIYTTPAVVKNNPENYVTIFDPEFESFADDFAKAFANYKNERDLVGYYSDNEINFTEDQLRLFLSNLPATDPNYLAALNFVQSKGLTKEYVISNYDSLKELRNEFLTLVMERYYSVVVGSIKKYDPNHLYLGTRLHGKSRDSETCVNIAAKWCDVVSVNYYNYVFPSDQICSPTKWGKWLQTYDKPCMITEFYAKAYNTTYPDQSGAGFYTDDQDGRGIFYQISCLDVLKSKYYIGWHYFRYQDDLPPKFSNKGMIDPNNNEYLDMTKYMEELNRQVYHLIDYYDNKTYDNEEETVDINIAVSQDTYLQLTGNGQNDVYGNNNQLSLSSVGTDNGLRDILLQFDLGEYYNSIQNIVDAKVRLHFLSGDAEQKLSITGLKSASWDEASLNGTMAHIFSSTILNKFGKGRTKTFNNLSKYDGVSLNVRNWLKYEANNKTVNFRVSDELRSNTASEWISKDNVLYNQLKPVLILTFKKSDISSVKHTNANSIEVHSYDNKLSITGLRAESNCKIFTLSGNLVSSAKIYSDTTIDLNLEKGIYIIQINNVEQTITQKIQI